MKLLLDENLSRSLIPLLESHFPSSTQVALVNLEQATDKQIWEYAKANNYIIVTKDSDFYDFSLLYRSPPKVIWLRKGNCLKAEIAKLLIEKKQEIDELNEQEIHCLQLY